MLLGFVTPAFADCPAASSVSSSDNGGCVSVQTGSTLTLSVQSSAGIPYRWVVTSDGSPNMSASDGVAGGTGGLLGGKQTTAFTFTAEQAGETTIGVELQSVTGGAPAQSVSLTVQVTDGGGDNSGGDDSGGSDDNG